MTLRDRAKQLLDEHALILEPYLALRTILSFVAEVDAPNGLPHPRNLPTYDRMSRLFAAIIENMEGYLVPSADPFERTALFDAFERTCGVYLEVFVVERRETGAGPTLRIIK